MQQRVLERRYRAGDGFTLMLIGETMRIALQSIRGNLFRAVLTMLGIVIGVGAVITMVALGTGAQRAIDAQMQALGGDILSVGRANRFSR